MSATFLTIFDKDGKHWVDTGHADVGPFDTRDEAKAHIWRIIEDKVKHDLEPRTRDEAIKAFVYEINSDYFVKSLNELVPETSYSLEQRTHHHHFSEANDQPEEGVLYFACSCGVKTIYIEDEDM